MHATAVFDGERWGNRVIPFSFSACCSLHFMDGRGVGVFSVLLVTTMMISFVA